MKAVEGETAVVIANGMRQGETILDIVRGKPVGTFITRNGHIELATTGAVLADEGTHFVVIVIHVCNIGYIVCSCASLCVVFTAREGSSALQALTSEQVCLQTTNNVWFSKLSLKPPIH